MLAPDAMAGGAALSARRICSSLGVCASTVWTFSRVSAPRCAATRGTVMSKNATAVFISLSLCALGLLDRPNHNTTAIANVRTGLSNVLRFFHIPRFHHEQAGKLNQRCGICFAKASGAVLQLQAGYIHSVRA